MEIFEANQFIGGWFVGDFEPTAYRTSHFEVSYKKHHKGEKWAAHYHAIGDEINYLIEGEMEINGIQLKAPVVFVIPAKEVADPKFHTDVKIIVVKTPSIPGDKYDV
jgi:hypothetical protein